MLKKPDTCKKHHPLNLSLTAMVETENELLMSYISFNSFPACHLLITLTDKTLDLIWIQTAQHSNGIPEDFFLKKFFFFLKSTKKQEGHDGPVMLT